MDREKNVAMASPSQDNDKTHKVPKGEPTTPESFHSSFTKDLYKKTGGLEAIVSKHHKLMAVAESKETEQPPGEENTGKKESIRTSPVSSSKNVSPFSQHDKFAGMWKPYSLHVMGTAGTSGGKIAQLNFNLNCTCDSESDGHGRNVYTECTRKPGKYLHKMGFNPKETFNWKGIAKKPKNDLFDLLKVRIVNNDNPTVRVQIGCTTFKCHMVVLQCYSDYFMKCKTEALIQLPKEQITPKGFEGAYRWMLLEKPQLEVTEIIEIFNAANFLGLSNLIGQCWTYFDETDVGCEDSAFFLYLEARFYHLDLLEQLMLSRINKFFLSLVASKEFIDLSEKELCKLLKSNGIGVNSEMEVFMSAVRWLFHKWDERKEHLVTVLKCVRFALMPPLFLVGLSTNLDRELSDRITCNPVVQEMIHDGICFTSIQQEFINNQDGFGEFLECCKMNAPAQRRWTYDKGCTYHHHIQCPKTKYLLFKQFMQYLKKVQNIGPDYWKSLEMAKIIQNSTECCDNVNSESEHPN